MKKSHKPLLREGLEQGDLNRGLVEKTVQVDRFKSKIGRDEDVVVANFLVNDKDAAKDLMSFIERGYDFVIDSDLSPGENQEGQYEVFVEFDRDENVLENLVKIISDVCNLTENQEEDWKFTYRNQFDKVMPLTVEALASVVPTDPSVYLERYQDKEMDKLKDLAGIPTKSKAPETEELNTLRAQAGII
jgi:hypothetical protein